MSVSEFLGCVSLMLVAGHCVCEWAMPMSGWSLRLHQKCVCAFVCVCRERVLSDSFKRKAIHVDKQGVKNSL